MCACNAVCFCTCGDRIRKQMKALRVHANASLEALKHSSYSLVQKVGP